MRTAFRGKGCWFFLGVMGRFERCFVRFRWFWWRFGGAGGALTGVRCVCKVVVEAFWGCCGVLMCVLGSLGVFELLWGCLEGDVGGVSGLLGTLGVLGAFYGVFGCVGAFWNITIHVRCLDSFCVQLLVCKDASPM